MNEIPDGMVDMVLCDLPYGVTRNAWDVLIPFEPLWEQLYRVCKKNAAIVLHTMEPFTAKMIESNLKDFKYCWYWDKHTSTGFLNAKKQPLRRVEEVAVFYRKQCTYNPQLVYGRKHTRCHAGAKQSTNYGAQKRDGLETESDFYYPTTLITEYTNAFKTESGHATAKPVELEQYLIRTYTNPKDIVLDMTMGGGTTGVAAVLEERHFIGIEKDDHWYSIAEKRILEASAKKEEENERQTCGDDARPADGD